MTTGDELRRTAKEIATQLQEGIAGLESQILDLEERLTEARAKRDTARLSQQRLTDFEVSVGGNYQCPHCWIEHGLQAPLRPVPGGTRQNDIFQCEKCQKRIFIPG